MKLRDEIALEVLKVNIATINAQGNFGEIDNTDEDALEYLNSIARGAYDLADAMMRVRKGEK